MIDATNPTPEKSQAEVAVQFEHLAHRIGQRAIDMRDVIWDTNTPENTIVVRNSSYPFEYIVRDSSGNEVERTTIADGIAIVSEGRDMLVISPSGLGNKRTEVGEDKVRRTTHLNQKQTIHEAAHVLGKARGELAHRKNASTSTDKK